MIYTTSKQWNNEYSSKGIPSSFRNKPSGSVKEFITFIKNHVINTCNYNITGNALDIGCGNGRNSIYLNTVGFNITSMDFSSKCIENIKKLNIKNINAINQDISKKWETKSNNYDIAIDTFCFKHQIPEKDKANYKDELDRSLKKGAYFLLTLAGVDDGYYSQFLKNSKYSNKNIIIDPENSIPSILYTKEDIVSEFDKFELINYIHKQKKSPMHGDFYERSTHFFIFKKK